MVALSREEVQTVLRLMSFIREEGFPLRPDELDIWSRLHHSLLPTVPEPPKDPRTEDDEYEPPLGLSQDV